MQHLWTCLSSSLYVNKTQNKSSVYSPKSSGNTLYTTKRIPFIMAERPLVSPHQCGCEHCPLKPIYDELWPMIHTMHQEIEWLKTHVRNSNRETVKSPSESSEQSPRQTRVSPRQRSKLSNKYCSSERHVSTPECRALAAFSHNVSSSVSSLRCQICV